MNYDEILNCRIKQLNYKFTCVLCRKIVIFKEIFGQLQCHYHIGIYDEESQSYTCCKKKKYSIGCMKCDHSETSYYSNIFTKVPIEMYTRKLYLKPVYSNVKKINENGYNFVFIKVACDYGNL